MRLPEDTARCLVKGTGWNGGDSMRSVTLDAWCVLPNTCASARCKASRSRSPQHARKGSAQPVAQCAAERRHTPFGRAARLGTGKEERGEHLHLKF